MPVADSFELRQALEDHNVPVKMVLYDGFGHPVNKPKQQRAVMEENENCSITTSGAIRWRRL